MITYYFKTKRDKKLYKIKSPRNGCWIDLTNTTKEDLLKITELTSLTYLDLQDILDQYEIPRIERQNKHIIIYVRTLESTSRSNDLYTANLAIIITDKYFLTISTKENKVIGEILSKDLPMTTTQRSKLLVYILLKIANGFTHNIKVLRNEVLKRKKDLNKVREKDIATLTVNEDILNQYLSSLIPMKNVFESISSGNYIFLYSDDTDLFDDMLISIKQSVDVCKVNLKHIVSLRESYQIIFTNRLNKTMQILTSFTIILTIPTIVSSIYGMNVNIPLSSNPNAFFIVILFSFFVSGIFYYTFHKKGWF